MGQTLGTQAPAGGIPSEQRRAGPPESRALRAEDSLLTLILDSPSGKEKKKKSSRLEECDREQEPLPDTSQPGAGRESGDGAPRGGGVPLSHRPLSVGNGAKAGRGLLPGRHRPRQQAGAAREPAENKGVPQANLLSSQDRRKKPKFSM
uniref:Uncharacterized protein n=1 Tax=Pipistrellus kuhlii TaxID=59472 RepID=A0A7J8B2F0_PIPKU|nr:hypothetical protein mPipKuh1_007831 [Pipistrellus kuhlii]